MFFRSGQCEWRLLQLPSLPVVTIFQRKSSQHRHGYIKRYSAPHLDQSQCVRQQFAPLVQSKGGGSTREGNDNPLRQQHDLSQRVTWHVRVVRENADGETRDLRRRRATGKVQSAPRFGRNVRRFLLIIKNLFLLFKRGRL